MSLVQVNGAAFIALSVSNYGVRKTFGNQTVKRFFIIWAIAPVFAFVFTCVLIRLSL